MIAPTFHHPAVCHTAIAFVIAGLSLGCAAKQGWQRTEARTCDRGQAAVLCFVAEPDQPVELRFADVALLPDECAVAPKSRRAGSVRIELADGRTDEVDRRWVSVRKGRVTIVGLRDGKLRVRERSKCDNTLFMRAS
jgi:hypothetical protein